MKKYYFQKSLLTYCLYFLLVMTLVGMGGCEIIKDLIDGNKPKPPTTTPPPPPPSNFKKANVLLPMANNKQTISYEVEDNLAIFQGDIVLGTSSQIVAPRPAPHPKIPNFKQLYNKNNAPEIGSVVVPLLAVNPFNNGECFWFRGIVPYQFDGAWPTDERDKILSYIKELDNRTNLTLIPRNGHKDYIYFKKEPDMKGGGSSPIGRQGGRNTIRIRQVSRRVVIHEILHSVGFYHEQSRGDRDSFVKIIWGNIESGLEDNFEKHDSDGFKIGNYDKLSIMHYSGKAFGKEGPTGKLVTIEDLATSRPIGFNGNLSQQDIDGVNFMYPEDYDDYATPPLSVLRSLKTTIRKVEVIEGDEGFSCGEVEFFARMEAGPGWSWKYGNPGNTTEKKKTSTEDGREIRPNWVFRYPLQANSQKAKVYIQLKEEDGGFCGDDDDCDINPIDSMQDIPLLIDTGTGEIWLSNTDETTPRHYIGQVGQNISLEGYHGDDDVIRANIQFRIDITQ